MAIDQKQKPESEKPKPLVFRDNPEVKKKIVDQGGEPVNETPAQFAAFIQSESVKWGNVVKSSGSSLD